MCRTTFLVVLWCCTQLVMVMALPNEKRMINAAIAYVGSRLTALDPEYEGAMVSIDSDLAPRLLDATDPAVVMNVSMSSPPGKLWLLADGTKSSTFSTFAIVLFDPRWSTDGSGPIDGLAVEDYPAVAPPEWQWHCNDVGCV